MAEKDNGGPAFPRPHTTYSAPQDGMTLRDWFAGQALAGLLAHPKCGMVGLGHEGRTKAVAEEAFDCADAMLEARK